MSTSGKWQVASGKWRVASGEWQVASGKWRVASGEWQVAMGSGSVCVLESRYRAAHGAEDSLSVPERSKRDHPTRVTVRWVVPLTALRDSKSESSASCDSVTRFQHA